jgi:hypothetical protein
VIKLDISNPVKPQYVSSFDTAGEAVQITLVGDYIYVSDTYSVIILK